MIAFIKDTDTSFPDPRQGGPSGCFARGGSLDPDLIIKGYHLGIFPWFDFHLPMPFWYCPMNRFVIFPDTIHVSHSMRTLINSGRYRVTFDQAFSRVIEYCGSAQDRNTMEGAWLGREVIEVYTGLHQRGIEHSVEVWEGQELVGGLYGARINGSFIGESMFSLAPSASKLALITLARSLEPGKLIDCQIATPHLRSMGGRYIPYDRYLEILQSD